MPKTVKLSDYNIDAVTIWHSTDIAAYRTLSFWQNDMLRLTIIPAKLMGIICLAPRCVAFGASQILRGFVLMRPCGIEIEYPDEMDVTLMGMSSLKMQSWAQNTSPWVTLRPR